MSLMEEKIFLEVLSGSKFRIDRYMFYNFHRSISEHYRQ